MLKIVSYDKNKQVLSVSYKKHESNIKTSHLLKGSIGAIINVVNHSYKYNVGDKISVSTGLIEVLEQIRIKEKKCSQKGYIYKCLNDGYVGKISECNINYKRGCSVCTGRTTMKGVNDVATTHSYLLKYFINKNEANFVTYGSSKRIRLKCPNCEFEKVMTINKLVQRGFSCPRCGDGISYPEKFMFNVLQQLNIDFETQKTFNWLLNKKYDFYIPKIYAIIETHGNQHYSTVFGNYKLKQIYLTNIKENDNTKLKVALNNGISNYIIIDCRQSDLEWIKNSVTSSPLKEIYDFSQINWLKCHEFACSSRVKEVCDLWDNKFSSIQTLCDMIKICRPTLIKYLRQGTKLGWCNYNAKTNMKESCRINGYKRGIPIEVFDKKGNSMGVFKSITELSDISLEKFGVKLIKTHISEVYRGLRKDYKGFTFKAKYEDMSDEEQEVINSFEGKESYKQTVSNTEYYLFNSNSNLLRITG